MRWGDFFSKATGEDDLLIVLSVGLEEAWHLGIL
jgi:hypothetical protein